MTDISPNMTLAQKTNFRGNCWHLTKYDFSPKVTLVQMTIIRLKTDIRPNMTFIQDDISPKVMLVLITSIGWMGELITERKIVLN